MWLGFDDGCRKHTEASKVELSEHATSPVFKTALSTTIQGWEHRVFPQVRLSGFASLDRA